jgi:hypothetical protein
MTGATAVTGIRVADSDNIEPGTSSFTFSWKGQIADTTINNFLFNKYQTSSARWRFVLGSSKTLSFIYTTGGVDVISVTSTASAIVENNQENVYSISVTRETATTAGSAIFFVNGVPLGAPVAIAAAATADINNTAAMFLGATLDATGRVACNFGEAIIYNRALSAAEVLSLYNNGPALADLGASQTAVYTSDFSAGTDGFSVSSGCTLSGNIDGIGGVDDVLRQTSTASSNSIVKSSVFTASDYKNYTIALMAYRPSANVTATGIRVRDASSNSLNLDNNQLPADTWTLVSTSLNWTTASTGIRIWMTDASNALASTIGDIIYYKTVVIKRVGITGWWDARDAQSDTGQILDSSGNKNHAMLPASGATVIGKPLSEARQVRWTNTWTGTQELQYIGGVNQAVLPAKAYIESIVGVVSGATVEDIIIGDGSDTDRYVALTTALAAGTVTFTLANRTTDGTNLKLTVDPDANATMSIIWTVTYRILE